MNNLALQEQQYSLTILNGADKGAVFKVVNAKITIGRGSENDIVIKDDSKISRKHAAIKTSPQGAEIEDISEHNTLFVNGKKVRHAFLNSGTVFQIGTTKISFQAMKEDTYLDLVVPGKKSPAPSPLSNDIQMHSVRNKGTRRKKGLSLNFYILLGIILLGSYFLLTSSKKKKTEDLIRPMAQMNQAIEDRKKQIEAIEQRLVDEKKTNYNYKDGKTNYIRGFRDYQKGRYDRAIEYFSACANVMPECERYRGLSEKKYQDVINSQMSYGRKYLDQGQFKACFSTFKNVMYMIRNRTEPDYKEAEQNAAYCNKMIGGN
jgi:tetratricopeptide (TPR) repeat protein